MLVDSFRVDSPHVEYTEEAITSMYEYQTTEFEHQQNNGKYEWVAHPKSVPYQFSTQRKVPKLGYACSNNPEDRQWRTRVQVEGDDGTVTILESGELSSFSEAS